MKALTQSDPNLVQNFSDGVWAAMTINFGPKTATFSYTNLRNLSFGWCVVTALGDFDPGMGGQLILWDFKIVVKFPPSSTIFILLAVIKHSNCAVPNGQSWYSITQFCASNLFRWVDNGFQNDIDIVQTCTAEEKKERKQAQKERWMKGLQNYPTYQELLSGK